MHLGTRTRGQWASSHQCRWNFRVVLGQNQAVSFTLFPLQTPQARRGAFDFFAAQVCHHLCFLGRFKTLVIYSKNQQDGAQGGDTKEGSVMRTTEENIALLQAIASL